MAQAWTVLTGSDVSRVLGLDVLRTQNENLADASTPQDTLDLTIKNRRDEILSATVRALRALIEKGGRTPLSATPGSTPPEAEQAILYITAYELVSAMPSLKMLIVTAEGTIHAPFANFYKDAKAYFAGVGEGKIQPSYPTNPVLPLPAMAASGEIIGPVDMSTDPTFI